MPKHIPLRTCVACRQSRPKRSLVRVVRTLTGEVTPDATGKLAGRGAYLCAARPCWDAALKKKLLEHALQSPVSPEGRLALEAYAATLPAELPAAGPAAAPEARPVIRKVPAQPPAAGKAARLTSR